VLRRQTTDATPTRLTADNAAPSTTNSLALPNLGSYLVRLMVLAWQTAGAAGTVGDSAAWDVTALFIRGAGAGSVSRPGGGGTGLVPAYGSAGAAAWRLEILADTTNGGVAVSGTGEANKSLNWVARVLSAEAVG